MCKRLTFRDTALLLALALTFATAPAWAEDDWPGWRGPFGNGVAADGQSPPVNWSTSANVVWKSPIPGRGHSSPVIVGDSVLLTTADEQRKVQSVLCYDRDTGRPVWSTDVNDGGFPERIHVKNTHASPTLATNGKFVFAVFNNHGTVQLTAVGLDGAIIWQKSAGRHLPKRYQYGYAASPVVFEDTVIVSAECEQDPFLAAFACDDGREVWRTPRAPNINYSSPIVARVAGRDQLLISGNKSVSSYNPRTGEPFWSVPGIWDVTCGTIVWDGARVYASGGFPTNGTMAVQGNGSKVLWQNPVKCYEQSLLVHDGFVYAVSDQGVAYCWNAISGREAWKARLGGNFSASPVLAGGNIYVTNENGTTFVFEANPRKLEPVAKNQLGEEGFATLAIGGDRIYIRAANSAGGPRREMLYCIGD